MNDIATIEDAAKTEEIQTIIDRMPTNFGIHITLLVLGFIVALILLGWFIKYPDIVTGQITINANTHPVKLVANTSGNLWINGFHSKDYVKEGDYIATIQNSANLQDVLKVAKLIKEFNINTINKNSMMFPRKVSLGELNDQYFAFINAYEQYMDYYKQNLLSRQEDIQQKLLAEQQNTLTTTLQSMGIKEENLNLIKKAYNRDSILFEKKVIAEAELENSRMSYLSNKDSYTTSINNITQIKEQIQQTENKVQQIEIEKNEKEKQIKIALASSYTDLLAQLKAWEQMYVFKSPIKGRVQFVKFWNNNQFIQQGEPVFTIIPDQNKMIGQMILPAFGSGKVKVGQEVIIKLKNYPYTEYGTIKGIVSSISLTTNQVATSNGEVDTYLVTVDLPEKLETNYGSRLRFQYGMKGTGEIITKDRRLIERLFDNLKYTRGS